MLAIVATIDVDLKEAAAIKKFIKNRSRQTQRLRQLLESPQQPKHLYQYESENDDMEYGLFKIGMRYSDKIPFSLRSRSILT
ncbi:hypothetical protein Trydic_g16853 [Trypoxylus dichotomus]